jgi:hypothetical protein
MITSNPFSASKRAAAFRPTRGELDAPFNFSIDRYENYENNIAKKPYGQWATEATSSALSLAPNGSTTFAGEPRYSLCKKKIICVRAAAEEAQTVLKETKQA